VSGKRSRVPIQRAAKQLVVVLLKAVQVGEVLHDGSQRPLAVRLAAEAERQFCVVIHVSAAIAA